MRRSYDASLCPLWQIVIFQNHIDQPMQRIPEPELMLDPEQAVAYAQADFEAPHNQFIALFRERFPEPVTGDVLDLGCGPGDIAVRFARAFPGTFVDGVDGAAAMLEAGRELVAASGVAHRLNLVQACLPQDPAPKQAYPTIISNSLLHHLHVPGVMWEAVKRHAAPGARLFVMDLMRPASEDEAARLVGLYAQDEPEVLRRDFYCSLCAAFTPAEVQGQLAGAGLAGLTVEAVSDRHLIVYGVLS